MPVADAGQMVLVEDGHAVDGAFTVQPAPGHTAGRAGPAAARDAGLKSVRRGRAVQRRADR